MPRLAVVGGRFEFHCDDMGSKFFLFQLWAMRYMVVAGRYIAANEAEGEQIQICRIYHMCEDYLNELLPEGHPGLVDNSDEVDTGV